MDQGFEFLTLYDYFYEEEVPIIIFDIDEVKKIIQPSELDLLLLEPPHYMVKCSNGTIVAKLENYNKQFVVFLHEWDYYSKVERINAHLDTTANKLRVNIFTRYSVLIDRFLTAYEYKVIEKKGVVYLLEIPKIKAYLILNITPENRKYSIEEMIRLPYDEDNHKYSAHLFDDYKDALMRYNLFSEGE